MPTKVRSSPPRRCSRLRQRARDVYREAILEAAEAVFARRGFDGTRMSDVAREAGIATGTVYNYFDSKEQVLQSLLAMLGNRFVDTLTVELSTVPDAAEGLGRLVRASLSYIDEHRAVFSVIMERGEHGRQALKRHGGKAIEEMACRYRDLYNRAIGACIEARLVRDDVAVDDLVTLLCGIQNSFYCAACEATPAAPRRPLTSMAPLILDLFLNGARRKR
jgi:AcrR family transcriptional regulator